MAGAGERQQAAWETIQEQPRQISSVSPLIAGPPGGVWTARASTGLRLIVVVVVGPRRSWQKPQGVGHTADLQPTRRHSVGRSPASFGPLSRLLPGPPGSLRRPQHVGSRPARKRGGNLGKDTSSGRTLPVAGASRSAPARARPDASQLASLTLMTPPSQRADHGRERHHSRGTMSAPALAVLLLIGIPIPALLLGWCCQSCCRRRGCIRSHRWRCVVPRDGRWY